ncbi:hypothetical protein [Enterococcus xiangfangensis]|uniref:hypothetical protein n=1 Tax=Enterococcus xiangfangensis TaxID=1296537 RepID=UPI0035D670F3
MCFWNNQRILTKLNHLSPIDYRIKVTKYAALFILYQNVVVISNCITLFFHFI